MKMEMLSMIFPNCLSHIVFFFNYSFLLTENNLLADVSKVLLKLCNFIFLFSIGKIISLGVPLLCMCVRKHVRFPSESQLEVHTQNHLIQGLSICLSASLSQDKTTDLELGNVCVPSPRQAATFGS